ncbi:MAG: aminopeptidase [Actinomycetota bacterium]|nr:aminopeptidase [Actinomycetota bacterium]
MNEGASWSERRRPARAGLDRMAALASRNKALMSGAINWTVVPYPTAGWAETAFGEPDVERLWGYLRSFLRLDQPDPVGAWRDHVHRLSSRAAHMNERGFDALHYRGPGTNLTVGLIQGGRWSAAEMDTTWGASPIVPTSPPRRSSPRRTATEPPGSCARRALSPPLGRSCGI